MGSGVSTNRFVKNSLEKETFLNFFDEEINLFT